MGQPKLRSSQYAISALISLFVSSCNPHTNSRKPNSEPAIYGGRQPRSEFPELYSTVALSRQSNGRSAPFCSAAVIHPRVLASAKHCFEQGSRGLVAVVGSSWRNATPANSIEVVGVALGQGGDFALAFLKQDLPMQQRRPVRILSPQSPVKSGESITAAGYGRTDNGRDGTLLAVDLAVSRAPSTNGRSGERTFFYANARRGSGVCFGDSGGPVFTYRNQEWFLVGTNSAISGQCGQGTIRFNYAPAYAQWIQTQAQKYGIQIGNGSDGNPQVPPNDGPSVPDLPHDRFRQDLVTICPDNTKLDTQSGFCVLSNEQGLSAVGLFPKGMVQLCQQYMVPGSTSCTRLHSFTINGKTHELYQWGLDFAKDLATQGSDGCLPGTLRERFAGYYCVGQEMDDSGQLVANAYGPFSRKLVEHCRMKTNHSPVCDSMRWNAHTLVEWGKEVYP